MVGLEGESPKTRAALLLLVLLGQRLNETLHLAHADETGKTICLGK